MYDMNIFWHAEKLLLVDKNLFETNENEIQQQQRETETKAYKKAKVSLFPYISHPTDI